MTFDLDLSKFDLQTWISTEIIYSSRIIYPPILKLVVCRVVELSGAQGKERRPQSNMPSFFEGGIIKSGSRGRKSQSICYGHDLSFLPQTDRLKSKCPRIPFFGHKNLFSECQIIFNNLQCTGRRILGLSYAVNLPPVLSKSRHQHWKFGTKSKWTHLHGVNFICLWHQFSIFLYKIKTQLLEI